MTAYVALLRAINLGARNRVSMPELREALGARGFPGARTHLQSGNVVLAADLDAGAVAREVEAVVAGLGVETPVVVRTREELAAVVALDPLGEHVTEPKRYQVTFLSGDPDPDGVRALEAADVAPERVAVHGREVYAWHPDGLQRSRLARTIERAKLGVDGTARNWNTVTALLALTEDA